MKKTILITGSTDGIGLVTAQTLATQGHTVLLHGRSASKLADAEKIVKAIDGAGAVGSFLADLSRLEEVEKLASKVAIAYPKLDVLINNAGVFKADNPTTDYGIDVRFVINTIAPYLLTQKLLGSMHSESRVINLSSAAQAPVSLDALAGLGALNDMEAYSQSKLAITMWSREMAKDLAGSVSVIAVNPGSLLASKMVKEGFGIAGNDITIGSDILCRLALSDEFSESSGKYFDNDAGQFSSPHPDALDDNKSWAVTRLIQDILNSKMH